MFHCIYKLIFFSDEQDSLHGSTSSSPPTMTSFESKYFSEKMPSVSEGILHESQSLTMIQQQPSVYVKSYRPRSALPRPTAHQEAWTPPPSDTSSRVILARPSTTVPSCLQQNQPLPMSSHRNHVNFAPDTKSPDSVSDKVNLGSEKTNPANEKSNVNGKSSHPNEKTSSSPHEKSDLGNNKTNTGGEKLNVVSEKVTLCKDAKEESKDGVKVKGILRKVSKYEHRTRSSPYPVYGAHARQQWVDRITSSSVVKATTVRDSLDGKRRVKWHEIQYDDGTSASISETGAPIPKPVIIPPQVTTPAPKPKSTKGGKKTAAKPRAKTASAQPRSGKKGGKGSKGRKLKPAKESEVVMEPHPPVISKKKQLSTNTTINYSIPQESEAVTMGTLRSSGSFDSLQTPQEAKRQEADKLNQVCDPSSFNFYSYQLSSSVGKAFDS